MFFVKKLSEKPWIVFLGALGLGVVLHFLYGWLPSPLSALVSPVRESLWEHMKLLFVPLLPAALLLTRGAPALRAARLLAIPTVCLLMLGIAWLYHVPLRGDALLFDLLLYAAMMVLGFLLPRWLWPLTREWSGLSPAAAALLLLGGLMVWFTFSPPEGVLFADLGGGVQTFLRLPV